MHRMRVPHGKPRGPRRFDVLCTTPSDRRPGTELSLDWLPERSVPEAQGYLTSLPGVGRKTAAWVLLFALGMRDIPVLPRA